MGRIGSTVVWRRCTADLTLPTLLLVLWRTQAHSGGKHSTAQLPAFPYTWAVSAVRPYRYLVVTVALSGIATPTTAQPPAPSPVPSDTAAALRVDSLFRTKIRDDGPGCAVGIYRDGAVLLTRAYGVANADDGRPITPRTTFDLGSAAKPFTSLAVLMLVQRGTLSLDVDVRRWIPQLPVYGTPIRIRDLLHHTSGLRDYQALQLLAARPVSTMTEFLHLMAAQQRLNFATGTRHEYSHSDFLLLSVIVERATNTRFGAYLQREVLGPLGMRGSFVDDGSAPGRGERAFGHAESRSGPRVLFPTSQTSGGDNLYASVEDLAHWDHNFDDPVVGGRDVIARMLGRPLLASGDTIPYAYGLRLGTYRGLRTVSRGGHSGGMRSEIVRFPDQKFTVATLCNYDGLAAGRLAHEVADIYLGPEMRVTSPRPAAPPTVTRSVQELTAYTGIYRPKGATWNLVPIELVNGALSERLFHDQIDDTLMVMTPTTEGRFFEIGTTGNVGIFTFSPPTPGVPHRLDISWNGGPAESLERITDAAVWRPTSSALTEYAGTWFSQELDATWQLVRRETRLVLRRRGQPDLTLRPVSRDRFERGFGPFDALIPAELQFHRDRNGKLSYLSLSTPAGEESVRDLRFRRLIMR